MKNTTKEKVNLVGVQSLEGLSCMYNSKIYLENGRLVSFPMLVLFFSETGVPPWVGYHEEEIMKSQILALSSVS